MGLLHFPRGIINPNYPGFQHLAHTLSDHFIDQQFDPSSDSEISDDCDFDSYPSGHGRNKDIISDANNNDNGEMEDDIDLNSNESGGDLALHTTMASDKFLSNTIKGGFKDDSETNMFCNSKQIKVHDFNTITGKLERHSVDMDFNEDDELEYIFSDKSIDCDSGAFIQYDCEMSINEFQKSKNVEIAENLLNDQSSIKFLTPDILIEHKSCEKPLTTGKSSTTENIVHNGISQEGSANVLFFKDKREYEPDLIKHIIKDYDQANTEKQAALSITGENELIRNSVHKTSSDAKRTCSGEEKISYLMQTEEGNSSNVKNSQNVKCSLPLTFESITSSTVDIIGDFGKEIEKEINLIVSGFREQSNEMCSIESVADVNKRTHEINSRQKAKTCDELVLDENKFMEHLKSFSRVSFNSLTYK